PPELLRRARLATEDPAELPAAIDRLARRAAADHAPTRDLLDELAGRLADAAVVLTTVLGPEAVVLGGYYAPLAPWVLPRVERALADLRGFAVYRDIEALAGVHGPDAPVWGAAALAGDFIVDDPARR
ncbi:MAG: ROK family protein, partial [Streptomycetaceae bacterium]|nr:ROK family protein [Streptomycetaceae bacterium]